VGWLLDLAPLTGVLLLVLLVVMVLLSLPCVRRSGYFQLFYWSHKLYWPYYILTVVHATHFWKWLVLPALIFVTEMLLRFYRSHRGDTYIRAVDFLASGVTQLKISRPANFHFRPGDYVFLQVPDLAKYEWHPFTISSAPEMEDDVFWLHIRSAGHWTKTLRTFLMTYSTENETENYETKKSRRSSSITWFNNKSTLAREVYSGIMNNSTSKQTHIKVYVDGPYGSPTREIFDTDHAVLIGSGIGVTPFASILQSIMFRFKAACVTCPKCSTTIHSGRNLSMKLRKVDFIWICRDQQNFEWFASLLGQLERQQAKHLGLQDKLTLHLYMTGARARDCLQGFGVQVALDIVHGTDNLDLTTGLETRTHPGRPDFGQIFSDIKSRAAGKVKVFMCGSPMLANNVKEHCIRHNFAFAKEQF